MFGGATSVPSAAKRGPARQRFRTLIVGSALVALCSPAGAVESLVAPASPSSAGCHAEVEHREFSTWWCAGPGGYKAWFGDAVNVVGVDIAIRKPKDNDAAPQWLAPPIAGTAFGSRIEWRSDDGKPYAALIGRWRRVGGDDDHLSAGMEIMVLKVTPHGSCLVATVSADYPSPHLTARGLADAKAADFRCGHDTPVAVSGPEGGRASRLDRQFAARETLNHNGSLMTLNRAEDGTLEIRYRQPRQKLPVEPGALVFRGRVDAAGKVVGEAYKFKQGCPPAAYQVTGTLHDGVLELSGAPPLRKSSCTVTGYAPATKPDWLYFVHEPLDLDLDGDASREHVDRDADTLFLAECANCVLAVVTRTSGLGTSRAVAEGVISADAVARHCDDRSTGPTSFNTCMEMNRVEVGRTLRAEAECSAGVVRPTGGGVYRLVERRPMPIWRNDETGEVASDCRNCPGPRATAQFDLLCPGHW